LPRGYPLATTDAAEQPSPATEARAATDFGKLAETLRRIDDEQPEPLEIVAIDQSVAIKSRRLGDLIANEIRLLNIAGRHADAGALETLAVRSGEFVNALRVAEPFASDVLASELRRFSEGL
jgi:hypothetical protein